MPDHETIEIMSGASIGIDVSSRSSGHTCCVFIETTPPGGGPPPHKHVREEEIFTVLEGMYEFYRDGAWIPMTVSLPVLSRRGTYHAFRNVGPGAARMMLVTDGGGIGEYFRAISDLEVPRGTDRLNEISKHYGYFHLPPSWPSPRGLQPDDAPPSPTDIDMTGARRDRRHTRPKTDVSLGAHDE